MYGERIHIKVRTVSDRMILGKNGGVNLKSINPSVGSPNVVSVSLTNLERKDYKVIFT